MKKTFVNVPELNFVDYNHSICFIGSCFSENISKKAEIYGFDVGSNPLGVVFNPQSVGDFLLKVRDESYDLNVVKRNDVYFSWEANSSTFGYTEQEIGTKIQNARKSFENTLSKSTVLFVTFGTAWIYELKENKHVVASCHKFNQSLFHKRLLTIPEITEHWKGVVESLQSEYPNLNIIFTLSPVRHVKDGLIENARSKAILLESIHQLVDSFKSCHYFPAYEIVLDELRDYGYFTKDGLHPNDIAINEVWSTFFKSVLSPKAQEIATEWMGIRKLFDHQIQYDKSKEALKFEDSRSEKLKEFKSKYLEFNFEI
ncbi:MAG: GSCFA domain containing protein [Fluviicola sp.]|nr:MAG: GSCFA domain containing protein [Fluviicola sp.]